MIEESFYSEAAPDRPILARVSDPERSADNRYWICNASLEGADEVAEIEVHSEGQITVLMLAFEWVRNTLDSLPESYRLNGEIPLNYAIARHVPYSYGDDIIEKAEQYIDELVAQRNREWQAKRP
tara:strand:+ start:449 stop:823 length:375 start_codon:yes stop_codon:yes gene_type:complete